MEIASFEGELTQRPQRVEREEMPVEAKTMRRGMRGLGRSLGLVERSFEERGLAHHARAQHIGER